MFTSQEFFSGVFHIADCMGVCMTLLKGKRQALLIDAGYGLENVREYAEHLAGMPVTLLLTHGHHDHALGAAGFDSCLLFEADREVYRYYTRREQRERVAGQAADKGLVPPRDFLTRPVPEPVSPAVFRDAQTGFDVFEFPLGGITARVYHVPGHTPGSAVVWIPEYRLLLTADNWNPCTWAWFPETCGIRVLRENMLKLFDSLPAERVLCSHQSRLYPVSAAVGFYEYLTGDVLKSASKTPNPGDIRHLRLPGDMELMFDAEKAGLGAPGAGTV